MLTSKIDSLILQEFYNHYNSETNSYIDILKEEKTNPYLKYCFYVGNNKILGYITYLDIYDRFEISNIYFILKIFLILLMMIFQLLIIIHMIQLKQKFLFKLYL